jgi:hypothetical protein
MQDHLNCCVAHQRLKPTNAKLAGTSMQNVQKMTLMIMCALQFEYQLAPGLGNSYSSSTSAQEVVQADVCA